MSSDTPTEELNRLSFERDLAVRQAKLSKADLQVIQMALNENRPLEALRQVNEAIDRLDGELEAFDEGVLGHSEDGTQEVQDGDE